LGGGLTLYNVGAKVYEVFAATRLTTLLNIQLGHQAENTLEQEGKDQRGRTKM